MNKILEYFLHASTWKGLFAIATAIGLAIKPELQAPIVALGMSLVGLVQVFIDDQDKDKTLTVETKSDQPPAA